MRSDRHDRVGEVYELATHVVAIQGGFGPPEGCDQAYEGFRNGKTAIDGSHRAVPAATVPITLRLPIKLR